LNEWIIQKLEVNFSGFKMYICREIHIFKDDLFYDTLFKQMTLSSQAMTFFNSKNWTQKKQFCLKYIDQAQEGQTEEKRQRGI
jgi:hypothetical protein